MKHYTLVQVTDYVALYEDDNLVLQDHSLAIRDLAEAAGEAPFTLSLEMAEGRPGDYYVEEHGGFPARMGDLRGGAV